MAHFEHLDAAELVKLVHPVHVAVAHDAEDMRDAFGDEIGGEPLVHLHTFSPLLFAMGDTSTEGRVSSVEGVLCIELVFPLDPQSSILLLIPTQFPWQRAASRSVYWLVMRLTTKVPPA